MERVSAREVLCTRQLFIVKMTRFWREAKRLGRGEGHRYDAMREIEIPEGPDSASATVKNRRQELQRV